MDAPIIMTEELKNMVKTAEFQALKRRWLETMVRNINEINDDLSIGVREAKAMIAYVTGRPIEAVWERIVALRVS